MYELSNPIITNITKSSSRFMIEHFNFYLLNINKWQQKQNKKACQKNINDKPSPISKKHSQALQKSKIKNQKSTEKIIPFTDIVSSPKRGFLSIFFPFPPFPSKFPSSP